MRAWFLILVLALLGALLGCAPTSNAAAPAVETNKVELPPSYRFDPPVIQVKKVVFQPVAERPLF